jgi:hypothetical protein
MTGVADRIISAQGGQGQGLEAIFTGKPCLRGHIAERHVSTAQCVECKKEWWAENRDAVLELSKKRKQYAENPERQKESAKAWRAANPERKKYLDQRWRAENPDRAKENHKKWKAANPERRRELNRKSAAKNTKTKKEWYAKNFSSVREYKKRWAEENRERLARIL